MLKYPDRSVYAQIKMLDRSTDIHFFIEDTTKVNYFRTFFARLLAGHSRVHRFWPCGGRLGVIEAAKDPKHLRLSKRIFLIDGDLYLLCGPLEPIPNDVIVLDVYAIENLFLCTRSMFKFIAECEETEELDRLMKKCNVERWLSEISRKFLNLFIWYAVALQLGFDRKTVSRSGIAFLEGKPPAVSAKLINLEIRAIRDHLTTTHGRSAVMAAARVVKARAESLSNIPDVISGKDYLLPVLGRYMKSRSSFADLRSLTMRLAHHCDLEKAINLKQLVIDQIPAGGPAGTSI